MSAMASRVPGRALIEPAALAALRERVEWKGVALILHAWTVIFASMAVVALFPDPLTYLLAVVLIGSRQLGLAILMHDGAHGCLSRSGPRNMALSQWLCAFPVFADTISYRRYHLAHHAHTQQENDPDLVLSAPFPITRASYRRKFLRDLTGQTGYQQRKAQLLNALGDPSWRCGGACVISGRSSGRS
jgi:fatty acid desaturase